MAKNASKRQQNKVTSFRIGRVRAVLRGRVWYLCYYEQGQRRQPRVGPEKSRARQMAAEINAQLEVGVPSTFGFEPLSISELRRRWLDHHEYVRRSSLQTIRRYRAATQYLIHFLETPGPPHRAADFRPSHAEEFVRYLRSLKTAPNGHPHARRRPLRDGGVKYVLETCSTLFNYAQRHRHLPPYAENPFGALEIRRIPIEDARPIVLFTAEEERKFFQQCDQWQFPLFLTLLLTGLRPGELIHLLLPDDLDLEAGWLYVRNKPRLGWQVKNRNERAVPLIGELVEVLRATIGTRTTGPVFLQRRCLEGHEPPLIDRSPAMLENELSLRTQRCENDVGHTPTRPEVARLAHTVWRDVGATRYDAVRNEFKRLTARIGLQYITAVKTLRHSFATILQDANVDPLIRNELMGHVPAGNATAGYGLSMTAIYTHTRPETKRKQLEEALAQRPAVSVARRWIESQRTHQG